MVATRSSFAYVIRGTASERGAASDYTIGDQFHETDTGKLLEISSDASGTLEWKILGYAAGNLSGKYWVSDDLLSPYQTWAAADAAAVADGHGPANPAEIIFMPGSYPETITLRAGIALIGLDTGVSSGLKKGVTIQGSITFAPTVAGSVGYMRGLYVESPNTVQSLKFGGTAQATLIVEECSFLSDTKSCIQITNTIANSLLEIRRSELYNTAAVLTDNALLETAAGSVVTINVRSSIVLASGLGIEAIRMTDVPSSPCLFEYSRISGQSRLAEGSAKFRYCFLETSGIDTIFWNNGQVDAYACIIDAKGAGKPFGRIAAGTASLKESACTFITGRQIDVNIAQSDVFMSHPKINQTVTAVSPNPPAGTVYDMLLADTTGGGGGIATALPPIKSCPLNHEIFAFHRAGAPAWTIDKAVGDTMIDAAGGAGPVVLAAIGASARFRADTATQTWVQV